MSGITIQVVNGELIPIDDSGKRIFGITNKEILWLFELATLDAYSGKIVSVSQEEMDWLFELAFVKREEGKESPDSTAD